MRVHSHYFRGIVMIKKGSLKSILCLLTLCITNNTTFCCCKTMQNIWSSIWSWLQPPVQNIKTITIDPQHMTWEQLSNLASQVSLPTHDNRIAIIAQNNPEKQQEIIQQAQHVHPIIHKKVLGLITNFLKLKKEYGSEIEKKVYKEMDSSQFINRLLTKRPLTFWNPSDDYLLRNGVKGQGGFEAIGTSQQKAPLILDEYLSYDEMQISALLGVSVPTFFINNGSRNNSGIPGAHGTFEEKGIYVGLVGTRFEKPGLMEWQHMIITPEQNTTKNGYGINADQNSPKTKLLKIWSDFYETTFATFEDATHDTTGRYVKIGNNSYLDTIVFKKRLAIVIEPFLVDAHERGKQVNKKVYLHCVGLGLGVWAYPSANKLQAQLMLDVYQEILTRRKDLDHISDINFSWFPTTELHCCGASNETSEPQKAQKIMNDITIRFSKRNPADKLTGKDKEKLLVAMYAWDGNAYPGNEYWVGALTASGDPAAACCSTIAELQNPLINPNVSAQNLFIVQS